MTNKELDIRKKNILFSIIENYLSTSEPVGSRTISKDPNIGVSAATVRNEMSDLEELGLLNKSHISSGRIPSEGGYKLYVNELIENFKKEISNKESNAIKIKQNDININVEQLIDTAAEILASITNYTVVSSLERPKNIGLYHVEILRISKFDYVLLSVLRNGEVNSTVFNINEDITAEDLKKINFLINSLVKKIVNLDDIEESLSIAINKYNKFFNVFNIIFNILKAEILNFGSVKSNYYGVTNIFNFPEYNDLEKVKEYFQFIEKKENIINLLNRKIDEHVNVYIGSEIEIPTLKNNSLLLTNIYLNNYYVGKLGVIGPLRMDYKNTIIALNNISWKIVNMMD
ncbi:heat-inducible transcriptional repressor HrcA [Miniphocaeibacter massiliensis]|uniref:heat-inducible transcriptional repressor HrcA n=1 Tax=Miniphocaeibacter massiliensis TaxID=2041841 RepID=UPI000C073CFF|nr:heat-inducible transcriptional repressor HrcA [Miniphocaeibacter massiliensis]